MEKSLILLIQNGASQGRKYLIHDGMRIGRSAGEIILNDSKIRALGWKPTCIFDEEIKNIVKYYKENFIW